MDEFNNIDELFKEGLKNAQITPPAGVWESIASSAAASSGAVSSTAVWIVASKWVVGSIVAASVSWFGYKALNNAPIEKTTQQKVSEVNQTKTDISSETKPNGNERIGNAKQEKGQPIIPSQGENPESILEPLVPVHKIHSGEPIVSDIIKTEPTVANVEIPNPHPAKQKSNDPQPQQPIENRTKCKHFLSITANKIGDHTYFLAATNASGIVIWDLNDGKGFAMEGDNISFQIPTGQTGDLKINAKSTMENGCIDSAFYIINTDPAQPDIWDVFTPNGDGYNDVYLPVFSSPPAYFDMSLYDFNDRLLFRSDNFKVGWNGMSSAVQSPIGKYKLVLIYKSSSGAKLKKVVKYIELIR